MLRQIDQQDRLSRVTIAPDTPLPEALRRLDRGGLGVLVLVDSERRVAGLLTDGDLRRALLAGDRLKGTCREVATANPVTAPATIGAGEALVLMDTARPFEINQLPLVDDDGRLAGLLLRSDMVSDSELGVAAVVMAGGLGSRLRPLTDHTPKPMLPVGGRPLMEHIIGQLRQAGIRRVNVTTHYQQDKIAAHFGNGGGLRGRHRVRQRRPPPRHRRRARPPDAWRRAAARHERRHPRASRLPFDARLPPA